MNRRLVLFRDRVSKLRPAVALFEQLLPHRAQVTIEVELLTVTESSELNLGLAARSSYPLAFAGNPTPFSAKPQADAARMAAFGGGRTQMAVTVVDGELFSALTRGQSRSLMLSRLRTLDGEQATLHIGDRYPVLTAGFLGQTEADRGSYALPPTVSFEELGVVLKVTPRVHNAREVTLELEAEFKSLAGTVLNGIPVISNRRFASRLRTGFHETTIVAGAGSESVSQSWSGLPLLALVPGLRSETRSLERSRLLLAVRPRLEALPPVEMPVFPIRTGSETRPLTPLD
jgi:type II secretory pathway component GspD/PulD (secretin)